jgi:hypothetical protein
MMYAMYCEEGHRIDFVDPNTGERQARYIGDFHAQLLDVDADGNPIPLAKFCAECGAKTMSKCHGCGAYIQYNENKVHFLPKYCTKCGVAFPWTTTALETLSHYTDDLDLSEADKATLKATYVELTRDTMKTPVAVSKFKVIYAKVAPQAAVAIKNTLNTVMTEAVKLGLTDLFQHFK